MDQKPFRIQSGPGRFLKWRLKSSLQEWLGELEALRAAIFNETHFQIVGSKIFFEVDIAQFSVQNIMLPVIGPAPITLPEGAQVEDLASHQTLVYEFIEGDIFDMDWGALLLKSRAIAAKLAEQYQLHGLFHIVFDQSKIELHFFLEKDYSQMQF